MALLLRTSRDGEKGVIVFTHKEIDFGSVSMRKEPRILEKLASLSARFQFGVHIGGSMPEYPVFDALDFSSAGPPCACAFHERITFSCVSFERP